ncbi:hypothetical protein A4A49_07362 [Nicotiana attenuata]|uniref:Uncharacterized protein n=1 Tax=Nicotiana attenuata TaxID=49451 RepID=A0A314LDN2_NICAT|nr:hypothetical protein A4A49_07362 [Nicotiana attenuata]
MVGTKMEESEAGAGAGASIAATFWIPDIATKTIIRATMKMFIFIASIIVEFQELILKKRKRDECNAQGQKKKNAI